MGMQNLTMILKKMKEENKTLVCSPSPLLTGPAADLRISLGGRHALGTRFLGSTPSSLHPEDEESPHCVEPCLTGSVFRAARKGAV